VQASPIGSAQVETLKHNRAFSIDSRARLLSLPESKRTDDRDEVHDLKKCARIEVVYDDSARPRATFFFLLFLIFDGKVSQAFLPPRCSDKMSVENESVSSFSKLLFCSSPFLVIEVP